MRACACWCFSHGSKKLASLPESLVPLVSSRQKDLCPLCRSIVGSEANVICACSAINQAVLSRPSPARTNMMLSLTASLFAWRTGWLCWGWIHLPSDLPELTCCCLEQEEHLLFCKCWSDQFFRQDCRCHVLPAYRWRCAQCYFAANMTVLCRMLIPGYVSSQAPNPSVFHHS